MKAPPSHTHNQTHTQNTHTRTRTHTHTHTRTPLDVGPHSRGRHSTSETGAIAAAVTKAAFEGASTQLIWALRDEVQEGGSEGGSEGERKRRLLWRSQPWPNPIRQEYVVAPLSLPPTPWSRVALSLYVFSPNASALCISLIFGPSHLRCGRVCATCRSRRPSGAGCTSR